MKSHCNAPRAVEFAGDTTGEGGGGRYCMEEGGVWILLVDVKQLGMKG